ncbi:YcxB family protein [Niabella ginsengisoli]|uniref:YcxB family protein n=1 Tax=Niabella ginsengisoli TaxID=522298 RepID=A0ABS9SQD5_9BACT|nr:YcxB family protein [Niabella ginsengisoli]MCH5600577.1 YcxB family protein [Niabella ginsengisoli]
MTITFDYNKKQVIQALRYHFISRTELRIMVILVNAFAILSLILYTIGKITPTAFLTYSFLWIILMVSLWFILPSVVYKKAETFKHSFAMHFNADDFTLEHEHGKRSWPYSALQSFKETPNFFHLYFDTRSFLLVPKDAFKDLEEMQSLREMLKNKI